MLDAKTNLSGHAHFIAQKLELRAMERSRRLALNPLTVHAGAEGVAVLFRYGVVVMFGMTEDEERSFLEHLHPTLSEPLERVETESAELFRPDAALTSPGSGQLVLDDFRIERLQVVADALAKAVVLSFYEAEVARAFERIEPLAQALQRGHSVSSRGRDVLRHIGDVLLIQGKMVGRVEVSEKPETLWEHPEFERLYASLEDEYELMERHRAIERKLELVGKTAETLLNLLHNGRSLRVEWYIVALIVAEIALTLWEMWARA